MPMPVHGAMDSACPCLPVHGVAIACLSLPEVEWLVPGCVWSGQCLAVRGMVYAWLCVDWSVPGCAWLSVEWSVPGCAWSGLIRWWWSDSNALPLIHAFIAAYV